MAKQIYIDENGNPIEVSGTINTAELLPISGNDPTDTKSYIDTGLSGKASITTPTISPSTGVTIGKNSSGRIGNMIFLALRLNVTVNEGAWTTVATVNANAVDEVRDSFLLSATSLLGGTVKVDTSGNIQIISLSALSGANVEINMAFRCS